MKPEGYPLPWCEEESMPYWKLSFIFCVEIPGWAAWQRDKDMGAVIQKIDELLLGAKGATV